MRLELKTNLKEFRRNMKRVHKKHLPMAFRRAIDDTAFHAMRSAKGELKNSFTLPIHPFIAKRIRVDKVEQKHIDQMFARIYMEDAGDKGSALLRIMKPHIEGGSRPNKRSEHRFVGPGRYLYPGKDAARDRYGNLKPAQISKALADVGMLGATGQNTKNTKKRYFLVQNKNQRAIVMHRKNKDTIRPFMVEGKKPFYKPRYDFNGVIAKVVNRHFMKYLNERMRKEIKKASFR